MQIQLRKTSILIVDDDQWIRNALSYYFRKKTRVLASRASAEEALDLLGRQHFDIILFDYRLPGMSGLDFLKVLRTRGENSICIFLSACATDDVLARARLLGIDDFIAKPFSTQDIENSLDRTLRQSHVFH